MASRFASRVALLLTVCETLPHTDRLSFGPFCDVCAFTSLTVVTILSAVTILPAVAILPVVII